MDNKIEKPGKPIEELQREYGLEKIIKLASNENPFGASPKAIEAIRNTAETVGRYPDGAGYICSSRRNYSWKWFK